MAGAHGDRLLLNAARARRLLLARAVDEADAQGRLVSKVEREQLEREALIAAHGRTPAADETPDAARYLDERARRMLAIVDKRDPHVAALEHGGAWQRIVAWGLPLVALLAGLLLERIDNPGQVNMLSPPLLVFIAWNLLLYLALVARLFAPLFTPDLRTPRLGWAKPLGEMLTQRLSGRRSARAQVMARFHLLWWRIGAAIEGLRLQQVLHAAAAAWAVGVAASIIVGGLVREYRVGWESTLLDLPQVHTLLRVLFAPVVALLPIEGFTLADVQRMHFRSGADVGAAEARHWIALYLGLLALVVFIPRVLLALAANLRARWLARSLPVDLREDYYAQVLSRVSPARVTIAWRADDEAARVMLMSLWREACADASAPWPFDDAAIPLLRTDRGDELILTPFPPSPPGGGQGWGPTAAEPPPPPRNPLALLTQWLRPTITLPTPLRTTDLLLLAGHAPSEQPPTDLPTLRLDESGSADLPLHLTTSCWAWETALHEAIVARLPAHQQPGARRLVAAWQAHHTARLDESMRLVADALLAAARDKEPVATAAWSLRRIVSGGERDAALQARQRAMDALLERLGQSQAHCIARLHALHGRDGSPAAAHEHGTQDRFRVHDPVDAPQAGMAGAASGAAAGATIDLITGGLTLGAAAALGAVLGGGAAMVAAAWRNRGSASSQAEVQLSDEMMQALTEGLLLQYLAIVQRVPLEPGQRALPPEARSQTVAAVEADSDALFALWEKARRVAASESAPASALAGRLGTLARALLAGLKPAS